MDNHEFHEESLLFKIGFPAAAGAILLFAFLFGR